jgi:hypothetical protein
VLVPGLHCHHHQLSNFPKFFLLLLFFFFLLTLVLLVVLPLGGCKSSISPFLRTLLVTSVGGADLKKYVLSIFAPNRTLFFFETAPESSVPVTRSRFEEDQVSGLLRAYRKKFRWEMVGLAGVVVEPKLRNGLASAISASQSALVG